MINKAIKNSIKVEIVNIKNLLLKLKRQIKMMNKDDLKSLSEKTREDGKRLFGVCEFIYNLSIIIIYIIALLGIIAVIGLIVKEQVGIAVAIAVIVFIICFINYMIAVLTTHVGKVLVHTSFASIGILEYITAREEKEI